MNSRSKAPRGRGARGTVSANSVVKQPGNNKAPKNAWNRGNREDASSACRVAGQSARNVLSSDGMLNLSETNSKYEEACARIRQNLEKFLDPEEEESSSEEDLDDSRIIQKTFQQYAGDDGRDIKKTQELLQDSLTSGALVCLICIESIKRNHSIWSCKNCYAMLHVSCIEKWAKDSLYHQSSNADETTKKESLKWCCPKCRYEYKPGEKPSRYFCFCGKVENPPYDPWTLPHSCGQICEKKLVPFCGHECLLLCHPGPCPPCPKTVQNSCYCKKSRPVTRRCSNQDWSCTNRCERLLSCGQHKCESPCHPGNCPPCSKQSEQKCNCGTRKKLRPCDDLEWQCEKVCGKQLECGHHSCQSVCHKGKCSPCSKSGPRPCPCNKKVSWLPCTEEVPPCGDTCGKLLECEIHHCSQRCHFGPCGACLQMRVMRCRCGQREKSVPCCKEFICDIKCKRKRDCGKHNCNRKCCTSNCPSCEAPCGRPLNCFNHKCQSRCHSGPCYPCRETAEIKCNCGSTKITIPCGRRKAAIPPKCLLDCKLPSECHHPQRHKHRCHFGACPPCRLTCGKILSSCDHTCPSKCHSAVLMKVEINKKKVGPWDLLNSYKMETVCKPCPPCLVPVPLACQGEHEVQNFPCSEVRPWSCGRLCGRPLPCGNHVCQLECHVIDSSDDSSNSNGCQPCEERCSKERPEGCIHPCPRLCHPDPCSLCKKLLKMRCHCQLNSVYVSCNEWISADSSQKGEMISCKNRCPKELPCGHRCPLVCHPESCPGREICKKKVTIRCLCKRIKQEVQCSTLSSSVQLSCDEECKKQQEKERAEKLAEELKKKEEEERKQELELKEYQKKFEGKKRKHKKQKVIEESNCNYMKYFYWIVPFVLVIFAAFIVLNKYK